MPTATCCPDQIIANVQTQLQQDGYYSGAINRSLDAATQAAIANYQRDQGLVVTATVDEPTVESLGLV
jgi:peptidoglycan hydrolase-like protein with peptidoglycan-binding domain